jgi:endonuclease YncB( thermonuclease family)
MIREIFLAACLTLGSFAAVSEETPSWIIVTEVVDGDTLRARIPSLPENIQKVLIRIRGIDTPEKRTKCKVEKILAYKAKDFLQNYFNEVDIITLDNIAWDKYRRSCSVRC